MGDDYDHAGAKTSADNFLKLVWPVLNEKCEWFQCAGLWQLEGSENLILHKLDYQCGIDYLVTVGSSWYGLSNRIMYGNEWGTFTLRAGRASGKMTEAQKYRLAMDTGALMPKFCAMSYLSDRAGGKLLSTAVVKTADLVTYIGDKSNRWEIHESIDPVTSKPAKFYAVRWEDIAQKYETFIWRGQ